MTETGASSSSSSTPSPSSSSPSSSSSSSPSPLSSSSLPSSSSSPSPPSASPSLSAPSAPPRRLRERPWPPAPRGETLRESARARSTRSHDEDDDDCGDDCDDGDGDAGDDDDGDGDDRSMLVAREPTMLHTVVGGALGPDGKSGSQSTSRCGLALRVSVEICTGFLGRSAALIRGTETVGSRHRVRPAKTSSAQVRASCFCCACAVCVSTFEQVRASFLAFVVLLCRCFAETPRHHRYAGDWATAAVFCGRPRARALSSR